MRWTTTPAPRRWDGLPPGDLIVLPAREEIIAALPPAAHTRVLLEFDPAAPAAETARRMRRTGSRRLPPVRPGRLPGRSQAEIAKALSLRSQPQLR